jgi:hypothetical protein
VIDTNRNAMGEMRLFEYDATGRLIAVELTAVEDAIIPGRWYEG